MEKKTTIRMIGFLFVSLLIITGCVTEIQEMVLKSPMECETFKNNTTSIEKCTKNTYICEYNTKEGKQRCYDKIKSLEDENGRE